MSSYFSHAKYLEYSEISEFIKNIPYISDDWIKVRISSISLNNLNEYQKYIVFENGDYPKELIKFWVEITNNLLKTGWENNYLVYWIDAYKKN